MEEKKEIPEKLVTLPASVLAALIDMSNSHVEDIHTGIEDGPYLASENRDIDEKEAAVKAAEAAYLQQVIENQKGDAESAALVAERLDSADHTEDRDSAGAARMKG